MYSTRGPFGRTRASPHRQGGIRTRDGQGTAHHSGGSAEDGPRGSEVEDLVIGVARLKSSESRSDRSREFQVRLTMMNRPRWSVCVSARGKRETGRTPSCASKSPANQNFESVRNQVDRRADRTLMNPGIILSWSWLVMISARDPPDLSAMAVSSRLAT